MRWLRSSSTAAPTRAKMRPRSMSNRPWKRIEREDDDREADQRRDAAARQDPVIDLHHEDRAGEIEHVDQAAEQGDAEQGAAAGGHEAEAFLGGEWAMAVS